MPATIVPRSCWLIAVLLLAACQATPTPLAGDDGRGAGGIDVLAPDQRSIGAIQGPGLRSPFVDQLVTIQGVVVGNFAKGLDGVFVQSERDDGDAQTAEGLFVETAPGDPALRAGDRVRVSGRVTEQGNAGVSLTTLGEAVLQVIGRGEITPTQITAAPESETDWERFEGMALSIRAPLTVTGNENLAHYGELSVSFSGRLYQPTERASPGAPAIALLADNATRRLLLDDNRTSKDPQTLWFLPRGLDDANPLRTGSVLRGAVGVLDQRRGEYRLQLSQALDIRQAERPAAPTVAGDLRIASLNLLNLFNGDGEGSGFPTERGAQTVEEYQRQQGKLVAVVQALAPDIAALMEVENDGVGEKSSLGQLVAALNATGPIRDFKAIDTGDHGPGNDSIRVAMIYRGSRVAPRGRPAVLDSGAFAQRSRPPLAQAFRSGKGPVFVLAVNHFKSKGCGHAPDQAQGADADQQDGQACWNALRTESARQLLAWLASDPTASGSPLGLVIGDLNAYALEDPLRVLRDAGWRDAFATVGAGEPPYSFAFDGQVGRLDHAFLTPDLISRLRGAVEWHNNADEVPVFDYHLDDGADPYRASDHDPILLGFELAR